MVAVVGLLQLHHVIAVQNLHQQRENKALERILDRECPLLLQK